MARKRAPSRGRPRQHEKFLKAITKLILLQGAVCNSFSDVQQRHTFRAWTEFGELELHKPPDLIVSTRSWCFTVFGRFEDHLAASQRITNPSGKYNFHSDATLDEAVEEFKGFLNSIVFWGRPPAWYRVKRAQDRVVDEIQHVTKQYVSHPPKTPAYRAIRKAVARIMRLRRGYGMWRFREMLVPKMEKPDGPTEADTQT